jgi:hypothetical protein
MARVSRVKAHLDINAVRQKIETSKSDWRKHRWLIVYQGLVEPKPAVAICEAQLRFAIAQELGVSVALVHQVISRYNQEGVVAIETPGKGGRPRCCNLREVLNGIFYVLRSGCAWRLLPHDFPSWQTVYDYFRNWRACGIWEMIHARVRQKVRLHRRAKCNPNGWNCR